MIHTSLPLIFIYDTHPSILYVKTSKGCLPLKKWVFILKCYCATICLWQHSSV